VQSKAICRYAICFGANGGIYVLDHANEQSGSKKHLGDECILQDAFVTTLCSRTFLSRCSHITEIDWNLIRSVSKLAVHLRWGSKS